MTRLIDAWKLCEYANNLKDKCVDANDIMRFPAEDAIPMETWQELKETVLELRDNGGTATQKEISDFLFNLMRILEAERKES